MNRIAMSDDAIIKLENLSVGYRRKAVLSGLNLELKRGSFTGLLGSNGSGKTTLIKTLLGILKPVAGKVSSVAANEGRLRIGYVPQRESLDPIYLFSAFEVAQMGLYGVVKPGRGIGASGRERVNQSLVQVGAESFAARKFSELSGGQAQRVLIARALVSDPELLVLDEPTAGIDADAARAVGELLSELHAKDKMTILMVNHELHWMRQLASELIWLRDGSAVQGAVDELLSRDQIEEMLQLQLG